MGAPTQHLCSLHTTLVKFQGHHPQAGEGFLLNLPWDESSQTSARGKSDLPTWQQWCWRLSKKPYNFWYAPAVDKKYQCPSWKSVRVENQIIFRDLEDQLILSVSEQQCIAVSLTMPVHRVVKTAQAWCILPVGHCMLHHLNTQCIKWQDWKARAVYSLFIIISMIASSCFSFSPNLMPLLAQNSNTVPTNQVQSKWWFSRSTPSTKSGWTVIKKGCIFRQKISYNPRMV